MPASLFAAAEAFALPHYREPHRAYHDERHVRAMLAALAERGVLTDALALAVWGHDLVYDPRAHDNEERSAVAFDGWLAGQGAPKALRDEARRLILATKHTVAPADRSEALLVDADLAILGAEPAAFDAYDAAIRREYAHVPEPDYRRGRAKVLASFLARPRLYSTAEFTALEAPARANLARALDALAPPTGEQ